jgi:hypothetical protein
MTTHIIRPFAKKGALETWWSTGAPKLMQIGDPVFFLKQGPKPTGIFGRGEIIVLPQRLPRDPRRHRVKVRVTELSDVVKSEFILSEMLCREILGRALLGTRFSGRSIPQDRFESLQKALKPARKRK